MEDAPCPSCGAMNPPDRRFCGSCGTRLVRVCPACGAESPLASTFCGSCGTRLADSVPQARIREERRVATVMFADLSGFTSRAEEMDPEDVKALAADLTRKLGEEIQRFGGAVTSVMGDAVMGVFGAPIAHEDDADRAVRCALSMLSSITSSSATSAPLELHIGINTGEVMAGVVGTEEHPEYTVMGDVTNTAARLQSAAGAGQILVGEVTVRATTHAIEYEEVAPIAAKGKRAPVRAWTPVRVRRGPSDRTGSDSPLIGRTAEVSLLEGLWSQVVTASLPFLATLFGPPGIGKSRLIREFTAHLPPGAQILRGRSLPYGEATGFDAFLQQVRQAAGILDEDPAPVALRKLEDRLAAILPAGVGDVARNLSIMLGLSAEGAPDKQFLFASIRTFVEALAREAPTVLVFEDLHWAPATLLSLIEVLASRVRDVPLLMLLTARPEFLEQRSSWGGGLPRYTAIDVRPLSGEDSRLLCEALLRNDARRDDVRDRLVDAGGGNPLFIEEFAASLADQANGWTADMPASVQAIIAARLDALPARERNVLQDASVIGRSFRRDTLAALSGEQDLDEALDALEMRDFVRRSSPEAGGGAGHTFKHILTMEVAYRTLPRAARRPRHATVAAHLEASAGDRVREDASLIAHHWKEAGEPERAVPFLMMAADSAARSWAKERAVDLFGEVIDILGEQGDPAVVHEARLGRAAALLAASEYGPATRDDLEWLIAHASGRVKALALEHRARLGYWTGDAEATRARAEEAAALARELDDAAIEARAVAMLGEVRAMEGNLDEAQALSMRAVSGWPESARDGNYAYTLALLGVTHYWRGEYEDALRWARQGHELGRQASNLSVTLQAGEQVCLALTGLSRHEEALASIEATVALGREWEPTPTLTARGINIMSGTLREVGETSRARELTLEGEDLARSVSAPGPRISAGIDLLLLDVLDGRIGEAEGRIGGIQEAAEAAKGWHGWLFSGRLAEVRARIDLLSNRPEEAATAAAVSLERALGRGRLKYACRSRTVLGEAMLALGRPLDAEAAFRQAAQDAERLGHGQSLWPALFGLARTLGKLGHDQEAEQVTARAHDSSRQFAAGLSQGRRDAFLRTVTAMEAGPGAA